MVRRQVRAESAAAGARGRGGRWSGSVATGLVLLWLGSAAACGGGGGSAGDVGGFDAGLADGAAQDVAAADQGAGGSDLGTDVPERPLELDFHVVYTRLGRIAGDNLNQSDIWMMRADGGEPRSLTEFFTGEDASYNCHHSCVLDRGLTWLAVAQGPPDAEGFFTFDMGRFNAQQQVSIIKGAPLEDVVDLHFGPDYLYYTKLFRQEGPSRQYEVWRVDLARPAERQVISYFPPDDVLEDSTYAGRFFVNPSGRELVFLNPTIRSQALYVWRDGALDQIDYICPLLNNGVCQGAGSEYSDTDPVAISPDGRYVALFVVAGGDLRVRLYDLQDPSTVPYKVLAQVPLGQTYYAGICNALEPWQYAEVTGTPRFSPDGASIYFVGLNDPERPGCTMEKPQTDILRIDVATILAPRTLEPSDLVNVTRVPRTEGPEQIVISEFDLSPDGTVVVFAGTPSFQANGEPIVPTSSRHENDQEIWVQGTDGASRRQVTNETKWRASAPVALP